MPARGRWRDSEPGPERRCLVGIGTNGHRDRAVFINRLVEDFSMAVKPADARPITRIEAKFDNLAIGGKLRLDPLRQIFKSLPRGCRNQYRAFGQRAPFGEFCRSEEQPAEPPSLTQPLLPLLLS